MKQRILLVLLVLLSGNMALNAQVSLTATSGTISGSYTTLGAAFAKINDGTHQGDITITLTGNTNEGSSAILYYSGYNGTSSYTSVNIYPTVTGVTISGNLNRPLIDLNGADNVTIDGRVNATGLTVDLVISNTNTAGDNATSTIRFINGATYNTVKYCTIQGSTHDGTSGILCFYTTTNSGNSNNTIDHNQITNANGHPPYNAIFSNGSDGKPNSSNTISNNNIFDVLNNDYTKSYYINLSANNDGGNAYNTKWTITGNSFYQVTEYISSRGDLINIIYISASSGTNFTVSSNYIGGSAPLCGGTWTKTANHCPFTAIGLSVGTGTASNIQGNTIKNFNYTNTGADGGWTGISVGAGDVNIGTAAGNIIGGSSGTGSINFTANGSYWTSLKGIYANSSGNVYIENNIIGSITTNNTDPQYATSFYGIYLNTNNSGRYSVSNNTIGSTTTSHSVNTTSPSTEIYGSGIQMIAGILTEGNASNVPISISNNTVANLTNGTTNTGPSDVQGWIYGIAIFRSTNTVSGNSVHDLTIANSNNGTGPVPGSDWRYSSLSATGIAVAINNDYAQTVSGNTVYNISNTYASFAGTVAGVYFWAGSTVSSVDKNLIYGLSVSSNNSSSIIDGIKIGGGNTTYSNNIITLGGTITTNLYGIYESGASGTSNIYFNTVYLGGSPTSGSMNSACLYNAGTSSTRNFRNNIFNNARSNSGSASGKNYAIYLPGAGLTIDYNDYYVSGTGGILGYLGGDKTNLADWKSATGQDTHSLSADPDFANPGGTTANSYIPSTALTAVTETGITTDYGGTTRSEFSPEMGAWEQNNTVTWTGSNSTDWGTAGNWSLSTIPTASTNVSIPSAPSNQPHVTASVGSPAACNNLTIAASAVLTIDAGKALTVIGTITNSAGNNGLVISSDATGTGSLIQSSASVGATVSRYITGSASLTANMYHFVSIPVYYASPTSNLFLGSYLYKLDAAQADPDNSNYYGLWVNLGSSTTTPLSCNSGYMIYYPTASTTYTFTGNLNTGSFSPTVSYGGTYTFNLVPNPYPSAINWGASGGWLKNNIGATAWIWNPTSGNYTTLSGNSYVPAGQAFIVMSSGSPVLTMDNNACVHDIRDFYKFRQANTLKVEAQSNNYYDESFVGFNSSATPGFDLELDGFKLYGLDDAPQLWTEAAEFKMSINELPPPSGGLIVPMDFKTTFAGQVTLNFFGVDNFDPALAIRLQDHLGGSVTDLRQHSTYVFTHDPSNSEKRFSLIFGYPSGISTNLTSDGKVWIAGNFVYISPGDLTGQDAELEIFNLLGQKLYSSRVCLDKTSSINPDLEEGMVIVRLTSSGKTCTARGYIH